MAKTSTRFECQECGAIYPKWSGRCEACNAWNSLVEQTAPGSPASAALAGRPGRRIDFVTLDSELPAAERWPTGLAEFDRATGGGLVRGSALLVGGDPGIGKSTLLLQVIAQLAKDVSGRPALPCLYISGEEAIEQIQLRAQRLAVGKASLHLACATDLRDIVTSVDRQPAPAAVVIDSIQTLSADYLDSAPGTVSQVRSCAAELIRLAKSRGFSLILVGHVTKEGTLAGPRVLEHMVDAVLYLEGERSHQFRILRSVKNRFGATDEIGVFEMTDRGFVEVLNPSALFLAERRSDISGSAVFAGIEGTRPVLMEVQALLNPAAPGSARRAVIGWDQGRLAMLLAVLEARCGLALGHFDVYLNMAGGLKVSEPAADLAVAAALISCFADVPIAENILFFGEIGLSGEIRSVQQMTARLKEAAKLGFQEACTPPFHKKAPLGKSGASTESLTVTPLAHLRELLAKIGGEKLQTTLLRSRNTAKTGADGAQLTKMPSSQR